MSEENMAANLHRTLQDLVDENNAVLRRNPKFVPEDVKLARKMLNLADTSFEQDSHLLEGVTWAVSTARADGRREGLEMAAAWHDLQVETLQAFVPASSQIERDIEIHRDAATAIRAMIEHEEG